MEKEIAYFGGGCFWCVEAVFEQFAGVLDVTSGYMGGDVQPTYEQVSQGDSGHVEIARVTFDPFVISYETLVNIFFELHDPTTRNQQGADVGEQYRSVIFYTSENQANTARTFITNLETHHQFQNPIVTSVEPAKDFYSAEEEHQDYYRKNTSAGYCSSVIGPKIAKVQKAFADRLRENLMTKYDFPQYAYETLKQASYLDVTYADGSTKYLRVLNYWSMGPKDVDVVECVDESASADAPETDRLPFVWIPSPEITDVQPTGKPVKGDNHESHPTTLFATPTINRAFKMKK